MARGDARPPRPPNRWLGPALIAVILLGAAAGVWVGLHDVHASTRHAKDISCNDSSLSIMLSGEDSVVASGDGARSHAAAHICYRAAEKRTAVTAALIFGPLIVILIVASARRSGRRYESLN